MINNIINTYLLESVYISVVTGSKTKHTIIIYMYTGSNEKPCQYYTDVQYTTKY